MLTRPLSALLVLVGLLAFLSSVGASAETRTARNGRLAILGGARSILGGPISNSDGWYDISVVWPGGSTRYFVRCPGRAQWCGDVESLDWSRDGKKLVFYVTSVGGSPRYNGIHVITAATGADRQLRVGFGDLFDLDWSPDGSRLAYSTGSVIYLMNASGTGERELRTSTQGLSSSPTWAPSGDRIAFAARRDGVSSVYVIGVDGSHLRPLMTHASAPAWSPDGTSIAVRSEVCGGKIKILTPRGEDVTPSRAGGCQAIGVAGRLPVWSPDGKKIAIVGARRGTFVIDADGTHLRFLTTVTGRSLVGGAVDASWRRQP